MLKNIKLSFYSMLVFFYPSKLVTICDYDNAKDAILQIRKEFFNSFIWMFVLTLISLSSAYLCTQMQLSEFYLTIINIFSVFVIATSVFSKLGFSIQTWKGKTIPEQVNTFLFKVSYSLGVIGIFTTLSVKLF